MDKNLKEMPDFNDLLFEMRNKDYGAYQLRKRYNAVVIAGIILSSILVSSAVILPFIITPRSDHVIRGGYNYVQVDMENLQPPTDQIIVPLPPPPPKPARIQEVNKYVPPEVVDTVFPLDILQVSTDEILAQSPNDQGEVEGTGTGMGDALSYGEYGSDLGEPFFMVEEMPAFRGGDLNNFREWVKRRTIYPQVAVDKKIQGRVFLTFIIETDGSVSNVTVIRGVDPIIDNEAVKAIQASPKWSPGLQRGEPVRVRYQMSLLFTI